jgi:hypothetical protein
MLEMLESEDGSIALSGGEGGVACIAPIGPRKFPMR